MGEPVAEGFDEQFPELWMLAYQTAYKILGDREEASDVAQDAVTKTAIGWERVREYPMAFTAHVAAQRAIDVRRRRQPKRWLDPIRSADRFPVEEREELVAALRRLPPRQRQVVVLRYLADVSEAETARALGCSPGTVKQHSSRALSALRSTLSPTSAGA